MAKKLEDITVLSRLIEAMGWFGMYDPDAIEAIIRKYNLLEERDNRESD